MAPPSLVVCSYKEAVDYSNKLGVPKSFLAECEALRNTRHRNLVRVITACSTFDPSGHPFKALILEYMFN